ncbi:MAG: C10 family peptidase [Synergistaceae bacterium]|jgi:hypothetical protein|nr:C10 family peptidase [Synergistaceae bacterium]
MEARKRFIVMSLFFVCFFSRAAFAVPTTPAQAENVVRGWLVYDSSPFGKLAGEFSKVESYGEGGKTTNPSEALYYAVYLNPGGIVLIPADDELDPITAYAADADWYGPEPSNPLYDTIGASIAKMVKVHRGGARRAADTSKSREKWMEFQELALSGAKRGATGPLPGAPSQIFKAPFLTTAWDQELYDDEKGFYVYNAFTPSNYLAGCGAVMMAQMMKFFEHPKVPVSELVRENYFFRIDGNLQDPQPLLGGDGQMGPYLWDLMKNTSGEIANQEEAESIGRLIWDCALAIGSNFGKGGTSSSVNSIAEELVSSFGYSEAFLATPDNGQWKGSSLERAVNANLDAEKPVGLGIHESWENNDDGHGVVVDGYGESGSILFHHVNMGWGGGLNVWYNLPQIIQYRIVSAVIYNIYSNPPAGGPEIISARLVTSSDVFPAGAVVRISEEGTGYTGTQVITNATNNPGGRFVFAGVPSNRTFTVTAQLAGHSFPATKVTTGRSVSPTLDNGGQQSVGNVWGVEIREALYSGDAPGGGCDAAAFPALSAAAGVGIILFMRRKKR